MQPATEVSAGGAALAFNRKDTLFPSLLAVPDAMRADVKRLLET